MSAVTGQNHFIRAAALTKTFGDVVANRGVDIAFDTGRVHALLGENGAGKSTLIAILSGVVQPDYGQLYLNGDVFAPRSPADALDARIATVLQRSSLVPELSIDENFRIHRHANHEFVSTAHSVFARLHGATVEPSTLVGAVDLGVRQLIEISRAIASKPKLLILDEPTALLDGSTTERLFAEIRDLTRAGTAAVIVTHKLSEAIHLADDVTVMRHGSVVYTSDLAALRNEGEQLNEATLVTAMFGAASDVSDSRAGEADDQSLESPQPAESSAEASSSRLLHLESVSTEADASECALNAVSLDVSPGEILAIAGISGNGQHHLAKVIEGDRRPKSGRVIFGERDISKLGVRQRLRLGIRSITDDRFGEGLAPGLSVQLNLLLTRIGEHPFWRFSFTQRRYIRAFAEAEVAAHDIRVRDVNAPAATLSGGNAQKLLLARGLAKSPKLIVLQQPTHGLDARTVANVYQSIRAAAAAGLAVILISADLDEVVSIADRVLVLDAGRVVASVDGQQRDTRDRIALAMSGGAA
jgi:simple sugar transport system ATP-binding protein